MTDSHEWIENSGTTKVCRRCGCIRYRCNCCTGGKYKYGRWSKKTRRWVDNVWKATAAMPPCDPSRPAPEWAQPVIPEVILALDSGSHINAVLGLFVEFLEDSSILGSPLNKSIRATTLNH